MTGIPCPTCFLTRATSRALAGELGESMALHAFGPLAAAALLWWSVVAIRQRRLVPAQLNARPLAWGAAALMAYWMLRLGLSFGLGIHGFPGFPLS